MSRGKHCSMTTKGSSPRPVSLEASLEFSPQGNRPHNSRWRGSGGYVTLPLLSLRGPAGILFQARCCPSPSLGPDRPCVFPNPAVAALARPLSSSGQIYDLGLMPTL